jgi:hypothetical protein
MRGKDEDTGVITGLSGSGLDWARMSGKEEDTEVVVGLSGTGWDWAKMSGKNEDTEMVNKDKDPRREIQQKCSRQ